MHKLYPFSWGRVIAARGRVAFSPPPVSEWQSATRAGAFSAATLPSCAKVPERSRRLPRPPRFGRTRY
eukprot:4808438-Lingulodinium_polyedra.AAC.1